MPTASIISIGDELLRGRIVDTNFAWLAKRLFMLGIKITHHSTVPDKEEWICAAFGDALQQCDIAISIGGLGPTPDDVTRKGLSRFLGKELVFDQRIALKIRERFAARGIEMPESNLAQAYLPEGATPIENPEGTAPGIFFRRDDNRMIFLLPGPPREMKAVFHTIENILKHEFELNPLQSRVLRTIGVPESIIEEWISRLSLPEGIDIGYYPSLRGVDIFLSAKNGEALLTANEIVSQKIEKYIFTIESEEKRIEEVIGELLQKNGEAYSVAESCTGGLLSSWIVDVPGSSNYFLGGIVCYSNESKLKILGVREKDIEEFGAVSPQVARQMALGVRHKFNTTYGIGITGIAGPDGGTAQKPVGLVFIGFSNPDGAIVRRYTFVGGREAIRTRAAAAALNILWVSLAHSDLLNYPFKDGGEWA